MSYTKTSWKNGDIITAEKLNKMEDGIEGAYGSCVEIVHSDGYYLDKTWNELNQAQLSGRIVMIVAEYDDAVHVLIMTCTYAYSDDNYAVDFISASEGKLWLENWVCSDGDSYPNRRNVYEFHPYTP